MCFGEGGTLKKKNTSLAYVGSACSVWTAPCLPQLIARVLSWSTLLRLQVALQGSCPKRALDCMHSTGLSCPGSGSQVLHKGQAQLGLCFVHFPGPRSSGHQVLGEALSQVGCASSSPAQPQPGFLGVLQVRRLRCTMCLPWGADLWLRASWQCQSYRIPGRRLTTGSLLAVCW